MFPDSGTIPGQIAVWDDSRPDSASPIRRASNVCAMDPTARVVVGVDTSAESLTALDWALRITAAFSAELVVVHAIGLLEEGGYRPRPDVAALVDEARRRGPDVGRTPVEIAAEDGPAADVVLRVADRVHADLIVVGRRGLGQAPRLLGSVSEAVLAHAGVPVLVVPHS